MSKLSDFLEKNKIDTRRLLASSRRIENLRPADRVIKLARRRAKGASPTEQDKTLAADKPRSGRPVSPASLTRALAGGVLSAKTRARITRVVNAVLAQKKKKEVSSSELF